jgi:hypothetical protein
MTKQSEQENKKTFEMTTRGFRKMGHEYKNACYPTDGNWLYNTCNNCNVSIYLWAVNGQFECENKEDK